MITRTILRGLREGAGGWPLWAAALAVLALVLAACRAPQPADVAPALTINYL
jgi:hypothetical protein